METCPNIYFYSLPAMTTDPIYCPVFACRGLNKQGYKCRREHLHFTSFVCLVSSFKIILSVVKCIGLSIQFAIESLPRGPDLNWLRVNKSLPLLSSSECNAAIHKKCIEKIIGRCTGTAANSRDTVVRITFRRCCAVMSESPSCASCTWARVVVHVQVRPSLAVY